MSTARAEHAIEAETFSDALYEWMSRAPWLALSGFAHAIAVLILFLIPWELMNKTPDHVLVSAVQPVVDEVFTDPPVEVPPEIEDVQPIDEPLLNDSTLDAPAADEVAPDAQGAIGDPEDKSSDPFERLQFNSAIGIGAGPGGKYGKRGGYDLGGNNGPRGSHKRDQATDNAMDWLARHQGLDGSWDCDGFSAQCPAGDPCDGHGEGTHDVGVTGLALLALLGGGNTTSNGKYQQNIRRGVRWLLEQQDSSNGLIGERIGRDYVYDHAIATLALCETTYFSKNPIVARGAQAAIAWIHAARAPYGAWRYEAPSQGDADTSITGWMVLALVSAQDAELLVDEAALAGALSWIDEATDAATGRVGYDSTGSSSSRVTGLNDHFPADACESMTAVALLSRIFLGQKPSEEPLMRRHAELIAKLPPTWDADAGVSDLYGWYYATYALYQMAPAAPQLWRAWSKALDEALIPHQEQDGSARGSWEPIGPWGFSGGRVYSTALACLSLQATRRYAQILGGR